MSYSTSNPPKLLVPRIGDGNALWLYASTDVHTDVDATDYFTNGKKLGMKVNDVVIVVKTSATIGATLHVVQEVDSDGNATVSSAILS